MTVAQRHEDAKLSGDAVYIKSCTHFLSPCTPGMDSLPITISWPPLRGYCHEDRLLVWITTDPGSGEVSYDTEETMGLRSLAAQIIAQNVPGCIQSISVCNPVTTRCTDDCQELRIGLATQKPVWTTCWLGPHPGMGWVKLDGDWSWCQCQGMQSRTLRHTGASQQPIRGQYCELLTNERPGQQPAQMLPAWPSVWVCTHWRPSLPSLVSHLRCQPPKTDPRAHGASWPVLSLCLSQSLMNSSENPWECPRLHLEILEVAGQAGPFTLTVFTVHYIH